MLLEDALSRRHSTTKYKKRYVLPQMVNSIVNKALSVCNFGKRYNFKVAVLTHDTKKKDSIAGALRKYGKEHDDILAKQEADYIRTASVLILIYKEKDELNNTNDLITAGALGQNICLLATDHYLGTLWIDKVRKVKDKIDRVIPKFKSLDLCYGIVLGYRDSLYSHERDEAPSGMTKVTWYWGEL